MLSDTQHRLVLKYLNAAAPGSKELVCPLLPKRKYVVFSQLLQFYLKPGMLCSKVHLGIKFTALPYLAGYIKHNTERRFACRDNDTKTNFYKFMSNSPYGKAMEKVAKRSDIRLLVDPDQML